MSDETRIYFMRDNHTFRRLALQIEPALNALREEFLDGFKHGSVGSKSVGGMVHCRGDWQSFEQNVRDWYGAHNGEFIDEN